MNVAMLSGGVGGGRFLAGLARAVDADRLTAIVNTGDDEWIRGLFVSPDVDSVLYHLSGLCDWQRGWGISGDTFTSNQRYAGLVAAAGEIGVDMQDWFGLGDLDLATHQFRSRLLGAGVRLSAVTDALRRALGISCRVVPMSETPVRTRIRTSDGELLDFEDYFVRRRQEVEVAGIELSGAVEAELPPAAAEALATAEVVGITPSNPLVSIGPILAIPSYRRALADRAVPAFGVSPIIGGATVKGPAARLLRSLGHEPSAFGAASLYEGLLDVWVLDHTDESLAPRVATLGIRPVVCDTLMRSAEDAARLAKTVLEAL